MCTHQLALAWVMSFWNAHGGRRECGGGIRSGRGSSHTRQPEPARNTGYTLRLLPWPQFLPDRVVSQTMQAKARLIAVLWFSYCAVTPSSPNQAHGFAPRISFQVGCLRLAASDCQRRSASQASPCRHAYCTLCATVTATLSAMTAAPNG